MLSRPRGVALGGVVLLHAGLVTVIGVALRHSRQPSAAADFVSRVIYVAAPPTEPSLDAGGAVPAVAVPRSTAITLPLPAVPGAPAIIDWDEAARRAAAAPAAAATRPLDHNPASAARLPALPSLGDWQALARRCTARPRLEIPAPGWYKARPGSRRRIHCLPPSY